MSAAERQRRAALARANEVKRAREAIHREVAELPADQAAERLAQVLRDPPPALATAPLGAVMRWIHGFGPTRVRKILAPLAGIHERKALKALTERQRALLAQEIREHASRLGTYAEDAARQRRLRP